MLGIMDTLRKIDLAESKKSFFNRAAWLSVFIPLVTFVVTFVLFRWDWHISIDVQEKYLFGAGCVQVISLILGIVSLFGIRRHGARLIVWKAAIGIIASCGMGFLSFVGMIFNAMGRNC